VCLDVCEEGTYKAQVLVQSTAESSTGVPTSLQVASAVFVPSTGALAVSGRDGTLRVFRISSRRLPPAPVPHGTTAVKATQVMML